MLSWFCPMLFIATQKKKTKVCCGSRLRLVPLGCLLFALVHPSRRVPGPIGSSASAVDITKPASSFSGGEGET